MTPKTVPLKTLDLSISPPWAEWLRIGTCSWKYDSWKGLLYETGKDYGSQDYLPDYASCLRTVEVDQWFWSLFPGGIRLPEPGDVKRYAESVPDDFVFSIKAPNALTLTHFYSGRGSGLRPGSVPAVLARDRKPRARTPSSAEQKRISPASPTSPSWTLGSWSGSWNA